MFFDPILPGELLPEYQDNRKNNWLIMYRSEGEVNFEYFINYEEAFLRASLLDLSLEAKIYPIINMERKGN